MHLCLNCKTPFVPPFGKKCYYCCDECRREAKRKSHVERQRKYNQQYKKDKLKPTRKKAKKKYTLEEIEAKIEQYNQLHHTRHTYGDWQSGKFEFE